MSDLVRYALESSLCLAFFYAVYWLFLKNETYFFLNRFYLISGLLVSFIIPGLKVTSPFRSARAASAPVSFSAMPVVPVRSFGWPDFLLAVYLAGALIFLIRFAFHLVKLRSVIRRCGWSDRGGCRVVSVDRDFAPFSFLNIVFLNEGALSPDSLERILAHEQVHIQQGHSLDVLLMELVITLQWFNPFVWPYKKSLQETHEYLADCGVIAQGFSAARYKLLVFEQHVGAHLFEFANNFKQSQIKRRLTMMSKIKSRNAAKLKLLAVLPLASFLVLAFAEPRPAKSAGQPAVPVLQETSGQSQVEEISKEKAAHAEQELQKLKEMEALLREKLKATEDQELQKELKMKLEVTLHKRQEIETMLGSGGGAPSVPDEAELKAAYKKLEQNEIELREVLAKTDNPEKQAEVKKKLEEVLLKQEQVKAMLEAGAASANVEPSIEELKKEYAMLDQKAADVRAKLEQTQDPQQKAELENLLKKIATKQEMLKARALELKASQEKKKN
jgi:BlaR1 peptidase M56